MDAKKNISWRLNPIHKRFICLFLTICCLVLPLSGLAEIHVDPVTMQRVEELKPAA